MQALGLIETRGLLPAIECADVMLKTAQVNIVGRTFVGGGLVTISVTGDVGAVKAAVAAGVTAVEKINSLSLISQHVIPRPHNDIEAIVFNSNEQAHNDIDIETIDSKSAEQAKVTLEQEKSSFLSDSEPEANTNNTLSKQAKITESAKLVKSTEKLQQIHKNDVDSFVNKNGLDECMVMLKSLSAMQLRKLAYEYTDLSITNSTIFKAKKGLLIQKLIEYYARKIEK